jgi:hypothetical protein
MLANNYATNLHHRRKLKKGCRYTPAALFVVFNPET